MQPRGRYAWLALAILATVPAAAQTPLGSAFTYQGRLSENGNPVSGAYDFRFTLFDAASGGSIVGTPQTAGSVLVSGGLFTIPLDFGAAAFTGQARWLGIEVRAAGAGAFVPLASRLPLTPSPHAVFGATAPWTGVLGKPAGFADNTDNDVLGGMSCANGQVAQWNGTAWICADAGGDITAVTAGSGLSGGGQSGAVTLTVNTTVIQSRVSGTCPIGQAIRQIAANGTVVCQADTVGWGLTGNAGTNSGPDYIGTTDNMALVLRVNGVRALRLGPNALSPNVLGGHPENSLLDSVAGGFIGGGGATGQRNEVSDNYSVVAGGLNNTAGDGGGGPNTAPYATVGGGWVNVASATSATVAGGRGNSATSSSATVGGGVANQATGVFSTVGGGQNNVVSNQGATVSGGMINSAPGFGATVGGGNSNLASGEYATVPGGVSNQAGGHRSFAAGNRAIARDPVQSADPDGDQGTFVWADTQPADFMSTGANQFLVRAAGGVGINTNAPGAQVSLGSLSLDVNGRARLRGAPGAGLNTAGHWLSTDNGPTVTDRAFIGLADDTSLGFYGGSLGAWGFLMSTTSGNVSIGGAPDPTFRLSVNGDAAKPGGGSWSSLSDARLKRDVRPLQGALTQLLSLRGVSFYFRDPAAIRERAGQRIGMLAQDVESVFPDWVETGADGYRRLTFRGFEALTVEALRDLRAEKDAEIARLRDELASLRAQVERLAARAP